MTHPLTLALLLSACSPTDGAGDDSATPTETRDSATCPDDTTAEPAACAAASTGEYLYLCTFSPPGEDPLTGTLTAFGPRDVEFTTDDGLVIDLGGGSENVWTEVPDLAAAGRVTVQIVGDCGGYGEGTSTILVSALDGSLLLLTGHGPGPWSVGTWSAHTVDAGCGSRPPTTSSCSTCVSPRPISLSGPASLEAWPGSAANGGGYRLAVGESYHGTGYECMDGPGDDIAYWHLVAE